MSLFSRIRDSIFGHKAEAKPAPMAVPSVAPAANPGAPAAAAAVPTPTPAPVAVDVEAMLTDMAEKSGKSSNWRTSIVDLMKLVGMESSLAERKELATELGYAGDMGDSATMNIWLHKAVMKALAKNGGKVPASMLD